MSALLCAACIFAMVWGAQVGWPWWAFVPLSLGAVFFFLAGPEDV